MLLASRCYTVVSGQTLHRERNFFGALRVAAFHVKHHQRSAEDICQGLLSEVAVQPGATSLGDDQTVLVLRSAGGLVRRPPTLHLQPPM